MIEDFKRQYVDKCINGKGFDEELNALFDSVLQEQFNDNHELMDALIQSIVDENTESEPTEIELLRKENEQLQQSIKAMKEESEMIQTAFMEISDYVLSK